MAGDAIDIGAGGVVKAIAGVASGVLDRLWPDKTAQDKAKFAAALELELGQMKVNAAEASSPNWFVAGWRPFIGWICGTGLGYQYLFRPLANGVASMLHQGAPFAQLDVVTLLQLLGGMLGLGTMRMYEKFKGVQGNH